MTLVMQERCDLPVERRVGSLCRAPLSREPGDSTSTLPSITALPIQPGLIHNRQQARFSEEGPEKEELPDTRSQRE